MTPAASDPIGRAFEGFRARVDALEQELDRLYEERTRLDQQGHARGRLLSIDHAIEKVRTELLSASGDAAAIESSVTPRSWISSGTIVVGAPRFKVRRVLKIVVAAICLGAFVWGGGFRL